MISVRSLRALVHRFDREQFQRQLGPFVLVQRPPDEELRRRAFLLGAERTLPNGLDRPVGAQLALLFELQHLVVATLPPLEANDELLIGRLPDCDLVIDDPSVSKRHAIIRWDAAKQRCVLLDLLSSNGTWQNGLRVLEGKIAVKDGDVLGFGDASFCFMLTDSLYLRLRPADPELDPPTAPGDGPPPETA